MDDLDLRVAALLSRYFDSQNTFGFNTFDFVHAFGSPVMALMYSRIFWPMFVELDGMIFLKSTVEDDEDINRIRRTLHSFHGDSMRTEMAFNLVEIPSIFGGKSGETTDEEDQWLADTIAEMWKWRLESEFPEKCFEVRVESPDDTGAEIAVVFFQVVPRKK